MGKQLRHGTAAALITGIMVVTAAPDSAIASEAPTEGASPPCDPPVIDTTARQYIELRILELPWATSGPPRPTCETGSTPECYLPIIDPDSRRYVELGIPEVPGVVMGPSRPTCETAEEMVMPHDLSGSGGPPPG